MCASWDQILAVYIQCCLKSILDHTNHVKLGICSVRLSLSVIHWVRKLLEPSAAAPGTQDVLHMYYA